MPDSAVTEPASRGVLNRRSLFVWGLCCALAGLIFLGYAFASLAAGHGKFVMPLDDVYIHFQYAKQIASGHPYVYNPGLPPTSGATSFLYPYVLAVGYGLGFQGLNLGLWAMIVGALALVGSIWLIYSIGKTFAAPDGLAVWVAIVFALTGPVNWHFMSGMETGLVVFFALLTLYQVSRQSFRGSIVAAALLALTRPEGSVMAAMAVVGLFFRHWRNSGALGSRRYSFLLWLSIPVLAGAVQPLVNLLLTGSAWASGNQAKSILSMIPPDRSVIWGRTWEQCTRMWKEFATGFSLREGLYLPVPISLLALIGLMGLIGSRRTRLTALLIMAWLLIGTAAVSTLDTAFWHFKRYQVPLMALFFPLAVAGAAYLWAWGVNHARITRRFVAAVLVGTTVLTALWTGALFWRYYAINGASVYQQPLQMAYWLAENTPDDAVVAVHDIGMMRYIGSRTTVDMIGLTTPGAADAWRNGPGAVAEFLEAYEPRPDYVAAYTQAGGLSYLADTRIYGDLLVSYEVRYADESNVALGGHFQGIYRPDWSAVGLARAVLQPGVLGYLAGLEQIDSVNVANLESESAHAYQWHNAERLPGYATEVYDQDYVSCAIEDCRILDGGRRINGEEAFVVQMPPDLASGSDVILVTRLHPVNSGTFDVYADDQYVATRWIPVIPGRWLEIPTLIPAESVKNPLRIRIVPHTPGGHYMPYQHWIYAGKYEPESLDSAPLAVFQNGAFALMAITQDYQPDSGQLAVGLTWQTDGSAEGDYMVFVHLYGDVNTPPVAQQDMRPGQGSLPPGNWLPGTIRDTIVVDLAGVSPGKYQLAIGLYDPLTHERLMPVGDNLNVKSDGRLFVGEIEIR